MADDTAIPTPETEVKKPEEPVTPTEPETPKEPTIAEQLNQKKETDTIPKARLDKEIARRKEAENALEELRRKASDEGMSRQEITADLKAIADEHGIDSGFLNKLAGAIKAQASVEFEEKLKPLTEREKQDRIDRAFQSGFSKAMENMPEYKDIVNPTVIKTLSLDPNNASKTFTQLIEETYGNALGGKRTVERATPRGGNTSGELDIKRAKTDPAYFKEVMADPVLKKQYNDRMFTRE